MYGAGVKPRLNSRRRGLKLVKKPGEKTPRPDPIPFAPRKGLRMSSPTLTNFLGGSPASVALRLIVVSFVVGMVLVTFGFEPADILDSFVRLAHRLVEFGLTDVRQIGRILATGALVVLPVWLVLRLLDSRRAR
jgi:hypothetical protein